MKQILLEVKSLNKKFGHIHAVKDLTFTINRGEVLGFLGPNGAGKSTAMKMITGFLTPTSGTALICGYDILKQPLQVKQRIGYLPEGAPAYGEMTVKKFLNFVAEIRGLKGSKKTQRIEEVMEKINLQTVSNQTIETLSKGFKRRVGVAHVLLHDPEILIMDEPTDGLDPNQKHEVCSLIREMAKEKAIIISTHILEEVETICSRAIIIASGEKLFDGSPEELLAKSDNNRMDEVFRKITTDFYVQQGKEIQS